MFFKFVLLIFFVITLYLIADMLIPYILQKYMQHQQEKSKKKRQEAFTNKMKQLEIK